MTLKGIKLSSQLIWIVCAEVVISIIIGWWQYDNYRTAKNLAATTSRENEYRRISEAFRQEQRNSIKAWKSEGHQPTEVDPMTPIDELPSTDDGLSQINTWQKLTSEQQKKLESLYIADQVKKGSAESNY